MISAANARLVIADDHPLFRGALREALAGIGNVAAIHEAGDFESAKALVVANEDVDLVLLDLSMPGVSGFSGLISLRGIIRRCRSCRLGARRPGDHQPRARSSALPASSPNRPAWRKSATPCSRCLPATSPRPPASISASSAIPRFRDLIKRLRALTPQQTRVLGMLAEGLLNKQIAYELGVSEATIKAHVSAILQKLGVDSRTQAVIMASRIAGNQWQQSDLAPTAP